MRRDLFIFNLQVGRYLDGFFISAVTSVLVIRYYLEITGFPQIGGGSLHIAHMLWGGLLMVIGILILLSFMSSVMLQIASISAGIGFGTFIDELGKFVTKDNNYFFEPTVSVIYVIFIILYIVIRFLQRERRLSREAYIANAFNLTHDAYINPYDETLRERAVTLISSYKGSDAVIRQLQKMVQEIPPVSEHVSSPISIFWKKVKDVSLSVIKSVWFERLVFIIFVGISIFNLYKAVDILTLYFRLNEFSLSPIEIGKFVTEILSASTFAIGAILFIFSRSHSYRLFRWSLLISILLTQFFDMYSNQLTGIYVLLLEIGLYFILQQHHFMKTSHD